MGARLIPSDVPQPLFEDLSCPTVSQCWVTGSDAVPRQVGITYDGASRSCSEQPMEERRGPASLSACRGGTGRYSQSYLSLGGISCPSAGSCVALGDAAQSAPSSPVYSLLRRIEQPTLTECHGSLITRRIRSYVARYKANKRTGSPRRDRRARRRPAEGPRQTA